MTSTKFEKAFAHLLTMILMPLFQRIHPLAILTTLLLPVLHTGAEAVVDEISIASPAVNVKEPSYLPADTSTQTDVLIEEAQEEDEASCLIKVEEGQCNLNPTYMLRHCLQECFDSDDFGTEGYFSEDKLRDIEFSNCVDIHEESEDVESCEDMKEKGECAMDPGYMIWNCASTCLVCVEPGIKTFPIGVRQEIHSDDVDNEDAIQNTANIMIKTYDYMQKIMTEPQYTSIRTICNNNDAYCAALAADGSCEMPDHYNADDPESHADDEDEAIELYEFMTNQCSASCQVCESFLVDGESEIVENCIADPKSNIFVGGDLNRMFERIVGESDEGDVIVPKSKVNVISRPSHPPDFQGNDDDPTDYVLGPWVVTLDDFLSDEECDRLIQLGANRGYERSTLEEEKDYDEEEMAQERDGEDAYRTSTNTWCEESCYEDPITQKVIEKLSNATGIPDSYSEHLQLLRYVPGQYYKDHHDWITDAPYQPHGPRVLTFFLYLNDVEEGGATRLTDLTGDDGGIFIDVQPKKGRALIWPSVLDEDPSMMDVRTYHEALPVTKGKKFGANAWFHLRNYKDDPCDYDALNGLAQEVEDENEGEESSYATEEL